MITGAGAVDKHHAGQVLGITHIRGAATENERLVAQRLPVHLIHLQLFRGQQLRSHRGYGLAGELYIQNVVVVGNLNGVAIALAVSPGFCPIAYFNFLCECQLILSTKYTLQLCLGALLGIALQHSR